MTMIGGNNGGGRRPNNIDPGPMPTNIMIGQGQGLVPDPDDPTRPVLKMFVVMGFQTPQGTSTFFLDPSDELELTFQKLIKIHQLTKAGLTYSEGM